MDGGAHNAGAGGEGPTRASTRVRKVAKAMAHLDSDARANAAAARLEALEQDNAVAEPGADDSGDEYVLADDLDGACRTRAKRHEWVGTDSAAHSGVRSRPKQAKGGKRTTRGALAERKGPKPLSQLLEEAGLEFLLPSDPSYMRAEMGPPKHEAPRRYCSVCGFTSTYTCPRCGMRYCGVRCAAVHADTRCLKFTVL